MLVKLAFSVDKELAKKSREASVSFWLTSWFPLAQGLFFLMSKGMGHF